MVDFEKCSFEQYRDICLKLTKYYLKELEAVVTPATSSSIDYIAKMPNGESLGIMVQCDRMFHESQQRTFEKEDQEVLINVANKLNTIPAVAMVEVTKDQPDVVQIIIAKLDVLNDLAKSGGAKWITYSEKEGLIFHYNATKEYLKMIKSCKRIWYHSFRFK